MTDSPDPARPSIAEVASESPEESLKNEQAATEDKPDTGGTVPEDDSQ